MVNLATFKREYGLILVGAIVFTASFLWRDLMADIKDIYFPKYRGILGRAIFTITITVILIIIAIYIRDILGLNKSVVAKVEFDEPEPLQKSIDGTPVDELSVDSEQNGDNMGNITDDLGLGKMSGHVDLDSENTETFETK